MSTTNFLFLGLLLAIVLLISSKVSARDLAENHEKALNKPRPSSSTPPSEPPLPPLEFTLRWKATPASFGADSSLSLQILYHQPWPTVTPMIQGTDSQLSPLPLQLQRLYQQQQQQPWPSVTKAFGWLISSRILSEQQWSYSSSTESVPDGSESGSGSQSGGGFYSTRVVVIITGLSVAVFVSLALGLFFICHNRRRHDGSGETGEASVDPESPPSPSASVVATEASGLSVTSRDLSTQPPSREVLVESEHVHYPTQTTAPTPPVVDERGCCQPARTHPSAAAPAANGQGDGRPPRAHQSTTPIATGRPPRVQTEVLQEVSLSVMSNPDPGNLSQQPSASTTVHDFGPRVFKYSELLKATANFSESNCLGKGGFADVFRAVLSDGEIVAVKKLLNKENFNGDIDFRTEVNAISVASHKHIVSLIGYCIHKDKRLIVLEFVPNNSLHHYLRGGDGIKVLSWPQRMKIALGTAKGLVYLHEECPRKIIHRDVKPANILLGIDFQPKVADFGIAKLCSDSFVSHIDTKAAGTPGYVDQVYFQTGKLTVKCDVYSFGVVLLALVSGFLRPNVDELVIKLRIALKECNFDTLADPRLQTSYDTDEMKLMVTCADACLREQPNDRPIMKQIAQVLEGITSPNEL